MASSLPFSRRFRAFRRDALPVACLLFVFLCLAIAGGASRADALGQAVVRGTAALALIVALAAGFSPSLGRYRTIAIFLLMATLVVGWQLVPLPPELWQNLPGREPLVAVSREAGVFDEWRMAAISPDGARNAFFALILPWCVFLLCSMRPRVARIGGATVLAVAVGSALLQFAQIVGGGVANGLVNIDAESPAGIFANRNHQALLLSVGIVLAARWGGAISVLHPGKLLIVAMLTATFALMILAGGSRTGIVLVILALAGGSLVIWHNRSSVPESPRSRRTGKVAYLSVAVAVVGTVIVGIMAGRNLSLQRAANLEVLADVRARALPTVLALVRQYFPVGTGGGGFDTAFRIAEPFALLKPTYFNHAHNDFLEVLIESGAAGGALLLTVIGWILFRIMHVARSVASQKGDDLSLAGALTVVLIAVASLSDYPMRTPIFLAVFVLALTWLSPAADRKGRAVHAIDDAPLPSTGHHL